MKLAAYSDDPYLDDGNGVGAVMPFSLFLAEGVGERVERFTLFGRVDPDPQPVPVRLPEDLTFVEMPWWVDQSRPLGLAKAIPGSLLRFWKILQSNDAVLIFGPSPLGLLYVALAALRRKRVVLGVRMDYIQYSRHRHPGRREVLALAQLLDALWRTLARRFPTVVVGASLAQRYRRARRLLDAAISLVREADVKEEPRGVPGADGPIRLFTVGRLDTEKNPLLLADILADLRSDGSAWELEVAGDGALRADLEQRARELGVQDSLHLRGFVGPNDGLSDLYRAADMFLHVSWTEGVPQVLLEAWATGLPVVATDVGGVRAATGPDAGLLVGPGDARAAADALRRVAADEGVRAGLVSGGLARAHELTFEQQADKIVAFVEAA